MVLPASDEQPVDIAADSRAGLPHHADPWLFAFGAGLDTEDRALRLQAKVSACGITVVLRPIDECLDQDLAYFPGLVTFMPDGTDTRRLDEAMRPVETVLACTASTVLTGSPMHWGASGAGTRWVLAQLVGRRAIVNHPRWRPRLARACCSHYIDGVESLDLLAAYRGEMPGREMLPHPGHSEVERLLDESRATAKSWGIKSFGEAITAFRVMDEMRARFFENDQRPAMHRPLGGHQNALDIVLDGQENTPYPDPRALKTLQETLARAVRLTVAAVKEELPEFSRPSKGARATSELRRLYAALALIVSSQNRS